ncbi:BQ2448_6395 [Microbotryum intermedium]|uniref:DASH complex subunit DAM1 n=1 Tax=Microbotryum intermedium TaxID=269621 RepID=A0A238FLC1_9BASI|nr:BQ2448_6395 [Microbotryum intermedium]
MSTSPMPPSRSRASSLTRRATTPLRRLSASSLRALSLSHSRSRDPSTHEPPLQHLSQVFAELADSLSDLAGNLSELDKSNDHLDGFNHAFASYLYGLRITAYTADFNEVRRNDQRGVTSLFSDRSSPSLVQAPTRVNFDLAVMRRPASPPSHFDYPGHPHSPTQSPHRTHDQDDTFMANASQHSFVDQAAAKTSTQGGRGGSTSTRGNTRGGAKLGGRTMTKKQREEMNAFAGLLIQSLPLKYREQQPLRGETEKVIHALRQHADGLSMVEMQKTTGVATHRVNDALTALVRVKSVLKVQHQVSEPGEGLSLRSARRGTDEACNFHVGQGTTVFRLDPSKFPPPE